MNVKVTTLGSLQQSSSSNLYNKDWTKNSIIRLLVKLGTVDRRPGSSRRRAHTDENVDTVESLLLSQEDKPRFGIVGGRLNPLVHVYRCSFLSENRLKFQSLGKISNISAADPSSFRSIPTLIKWRIKLIN